MKEYYTDSADEKKADRSVALYVYFLERQVKDVGKRMEIQKIKLPRNQLPQEGGKQPAAKNASEVIHVTGVNFSANYNSSGAKKY